MKMIAELEPTTLPRKRPGRISYLPKVRPSILEAMDSEPELDICLCRELLVLFVNHHPTALIPGTTLEFMGIYGRLHQLRHRYPRKK